MAKYVALLRGINVGGKTRVEMPRLKMTFEGLGCKDVSTYINSGNVIFSDERLADDLASLLEAAITQDFGLNVPVVVRSASNIAMLAQKIPLNWTNDAQQKTDVMFLWNDVDNKQVLDKIAINPAIENALYLPGAVVWNISRLDVTRGSGVRIMKTDLYKRMTVRNINTVRKLAQLMNG